MQYIECSNLDCTHNSKFTCSACKSVMYCSKSCFNEDWKSYHNEECEYLKHYDHKIENIGVIFTAAGLALGAGGLAALVGVVASPRKRFAIKKIEKLVIEYQDVFEENKAIRKENNLPKRQFPVIDVDKKTKMKELKRIIKSLKRQIAAIKAENTTYS